MISVGDDVAVGVSGDGDEIINVVGQWRRSVRKEEGLEIGAHGRAESGDH